MGRLGDGGRGGPFVCRMAGHDRLRESRIQLQGGRVFVRRIMCCVVTRTHEARAHRAPSRFRATFERNMRSMRHQRTQVVANQQANHPAISSSTFIRSSSLPEYSMRRIHIGSYPALISYILCFTSLLY